MKQPYAALLKHLGIPDVRQWVDVEEQASVIDIRSALQEKLFSIADMAVGMMNPEAYEQLLEAQVFTEADHERIKRLHERVMLLGKDCVLAELASTEHEEGVLVQQLCAAMPAIIEEAKWLVEKTKKAYQGHAAGSGSVSYLG